MICAWRLSIVIAAPVLKKHGIKFFKHNVSLTILITVHPRAAAAALSPSRGRKGKRRKTRFPLRGSAAVAAKGCTGQNVEMTLYRHPDSQPAACLPMQSLTILITVHPCAAAAALSPRESVSRNFQSSMAPYKFRSLATPQGGARVSDEKNLFPLEGKCRCCGKRVYGVERRNDTLLSS